jgi:ABC-type nitrate/sulfonate/bicarbonate transport system ATPase subunit
VAFLEIRRVSKTYVAAGGAAHPALRDLSVDIEAGEFAVVLGPSGCGKTTLLRLVSGLDRAFDGSIRLADPRVAVVFQEPRLLPWMTAADNVRFVLAPRDGEAMGHPPAGAPSAARMRNSVGEWLTRVGLSASAFAYPHQLSIGMQQRVALARAFAVQPRLLLLDEPMSALDEVTARHVADHLLGLWDAERPAVLMVTHRVEEAVTLADRIWVLTRRPGRVWASWHIPLPRPRTAGPAFWAEVERLRAAVEEAAGADAEFAE